MNEVLLRITKLKDDLIKYETVESGKIFSTNALPFIKNKWLGLCILEDEFHSILTFIRCIPGIASTVIVNVNHTECIQILNTLIMLISNVNVLKHLEEFNNSLAETEDKEILFATQSFKMNRCKYQLLSYLSSLQEIIELHRKDIDQWLKNGVERSTRKSSMHM